MASNTCKENKLKEFQFKFIHRIVTTKKELCRYGISTDSDCIYCGESDSIKHTFIDCEFTTQHGSNFQPDTFKHPTYMKPVRKFNYTLLFMKFYVYVSKLNNSSLVLTEFITRINYHTKLKICKLTPKKYS